MRPNILWICLDTVRADALEPYGAPAGASPAIADLARRGHAVQGVRSTACWTLPAHVSMFAGRLPRALGFADQVGLTVHHARPVVHDLKDRLLSEVLRRDGYRTGAVSTNAWVSCHAGFDAGFERFEDVPDARQARMASPRLRDRLGWAAEVARANVDDGAAESGRILREWNAEPATAPFFHFVNLVEAHSPYLPPKPYSELRLPARLRAGEEARRHLTQGAVWLASVKREAPAEPVLERMRAGYRGGVRLMDDWLARVLQDLEDSGRLDDTLVLVSADHGENFGENGLMAHCFSLDDRLINVPLIAAGPGAEQLRDVRSLAELPGRLAAIAGVAGSPYVEEDLPPLPVAQFDPPAAPRDDEKTRWAIDRWKLDEEAVVRLTTSMIAAVDGRHKLVVREGTEMFHDLEADPLEARPLAAGALDAGVVARLRAALEHPAAVASSARVEASAAPAADVSDDELADLEDRMRLLGYL